MKRTVLILLFPGLLAAMTCPEIKVDIFPKDNPWNWDITKLEVDPLSADYVNSIGASGSLHPDFGTGSNGIPYCKASSSRCNVNFSYDVSDKGEYYIPSDAPVEGGGVGDAHVIAVDEERMKIYELYQGKPGWSATGAFIWDLRKNETKKDTSADAAGLCIFAGLVRYYEVAKGEITHAIRMTCKKTQRKFIYPASHYASKITDAKVPPMGLRFRLKDSFGIESYSAANKVILTALKKHGMFVTDNGGDWFISGAPDDRWNNMDLENLKKAKGNDFEAVKTVNGNTPVIPVSGGDPNMKGGGGMPALDPLEKVRLSGGPYKNGKVLRFLGLPNGSLTIKVLTKEGKLVKDISSNAGDVMWKIDNVSAGDYIIEITDKKKNKKEIPIKVEN